MDRILILLKADALPDVLPCALEACRMALFPKRLSFGLCLQEPLTAAEEAELAALPQVKIHLGGEDLWRLSMDFWHGETYLLLGHPALLWSRGWDVRLQQALGACPSSGKEGVLTGFLTGPEDPVDAPRPVAAEGFAADGRLVLRKGTPLRYAKKPQSSAFLHPAFAFGSARFFVEMSEAAADVPLYWTAFLQGWELYTLHRPILRMRWDVMPSPVAPPDIATTEEKALRTFAARFGIGWDRRHIAPMARVGVYTSNLDFPRRVPLAVRGQEQLRSLLHGKRRDNPLLVTAWYAMAEEGADDQQEKLLAFSYLSAMKNLALLCFADGDMARRAAPIQPNLMAMKPRYGLPVPEEAIRQDPRQWMKLSKMFFLAQGREKMLNHSTYGWIDFDYQTYPVYAHTVVEWGGLCQEKIVMAQVGHVPDTSLMLVPEKRLNALLEAIAVWVLAQWQTKGVLPSEESLWQHLWQVYPSWFHLVAMPRQRELLELTMIAREEEVFTK